MRAGKGPGQESSHKPHALLTGEIVGVVNSYCATYLITFGGSGLSVTTGAPGTSFGQPLTVTVTYPYQFLVFQNIANTFFGGSFGTINADCSDRYEI